MSYYLGVVPLDLLAMIRIMETIGLITTVEYNKALNTLEFSASEGSDKPYPVPEFKSKKTTRLSGKAMSQWTHIRNWPLVVKKFVLDPEENVVRMCLLLHEIVERVTAYEFYPYEIDLLEEKILRYLEMRQKAYVDYPNIMPSPKPKHHYMRVYFHRTFTGQFLCLVIESIFSLLKVTNLLNLFLSPND